MSRPFVAVVDDEAVMRHLLTHLLRKSGYDTEGYADGEDFLDRYAPRFGRIVLNMLMPNLDGLETLHEIAARRWSVPVIGRSGDSSYEEPMLRAGAVAFCHLARFDGKELLAKVREAVEEGTSLCPWILNSG